MAYESQRDKPFYETGYTTDEDAEQLHVEKLARQYVPIKHKHRRRTNSQDHVSDRDYDLEVLSMDEVREIRRQPRAGRAGIAAAREALDQVQYEQDLVELDGDQKMAAARRRARAERRL